MDTDLPDELATDRPQDPEASGQYTVSRSEARLTLDQQIESLRQLDAKAVRILRANILLIGLILTGISVVLNSGVDPFRFLNTHTILGGFLLFLSCSFAGMTYLVTEFKIGIGPDPIRPMLDDEIGNGELRVRLANGYADWIEFNESAIEVNGLLATLTIISLIDALALLTIGSIVGALDVSRTWSSVAIFGVLLVLLGISDAVLYKIDLWIYGRDASSEERSS